ncbi:helix-turn-helix domain-containing protein [Roseospira goensis]|uniref:IclR family mhp operon transcriptional activator n=1 Tax=Roseospira goensis TaxID=391922 RepID=A0A7W6S094_9PROT|nr:helix-turn-helix domain-containing protein [Roseospira goensis]MBB4285894.1 IclR family mhp operon transcriptional activator [Roseospira goensis]
MASFNPVTALTRGLDVLRTVNQLGTASVGQVHAETGLHKATIVRMLETLEHEGYIARSHNEAKYHPTGRVLLLASGYDLHRRVAEIADPIMGEFRRSIGWPSDVGVFDEDAMIIVLTSRAFGTLSFNRQVGARAPLFGTALGRAFICHAPAAVRTAAAARLAASPDPWDAPARDPAVLRALVDDVVGQGYAVIDETLCTQRYDKAIWAVAVPIRAGDRVFGSVNAMALRSAIDLNTFVAGILPPLRETAARLAAGLAETAPRP